MAALNTYGAHLYIWRTFQRNTYNESSRQRAGFFYSSAGTLLYFGEHLPYFSASAVMGDNRRTLVLEVVLFEMQRQHQETQYELQTERNEDELQFPIEPPSSANHFP
jgi:hypothetical protein